MVLTLRFYVDVVKLSLDKGRCIGCDVCSKVCPKEAISVMDAGGRLKVSIDQSKCVLCGACEPLCPTGAIRVRVNDKGGNLLVEKGGFPLPLEKLHLDTSSCPEGCADAAKACPTGALRSEGETVKFEDWRCLRCPWCEDACEHGAVKVNPFFLGTIAIDTSKCSDGCDACSKVCPTGAIRMEGGKPKVLDRYCVFCNACLLVCKDGAIDVRRYHAFVSEGFSALWSSSLAKLLEVRSSARQLDAHSRKKLRSLLSKSRVV